MRKQYPIPPEAARTLAGIPPEFHDDGCSNAPDALFGFDFRWACRIHDWRWCTRCHPPGTMTEDARRESNRELKLHIRAALPWRWRWAGWIYRGAVHWLGWGSWDTCGPYHFDEDAGEYSEVDVCRHGMEQPAWMLEAVTMPTLRECRPL